jgi:hypothetical protein
MPVSNGVRLRWLGSGTTTSAPMITCTDGPRPKSRQGLMSLPHDLGPGRSRPARLDVGNPDNDESSGEEVVAKEDVRQDQGPPRSKRSMG